MSDDHEAPLVGLPKGSGCFLRYGKPVWKPDIGMAFVEITSAEDIYDVLESDATFAPLLGALNFAEGSQAGLLVAVASNPLEEIDSAEGLVVIIEKDPEYTSKRFLTADARIDRIFTLRLIQFPGSSRNLTAAIERLLLIFPGATFVNIGAPDLVAGEGQGVVRLPSNPVAHI